MNLEGMAALPAMSLRTEWSLDERPHASVEKAERIERRGCGRLRRAFHFFVGGRGDGRIDVVRERGTAAGGSGIAGDGADGIRLHPTASASTPRHPPPPHGIRLHPDGKRSGHGGESVATSSRSHNRDDDGPSTIDGTPWKRPWRSRIVVEDGADSPRVDAALHGPCCRSTAERDRLFAFSFPGGVCRRH